jgi:hypothetical protein
VEGRRLDALLDRPIDRAIEDPGVVLVHAETKLPLTMTPRSCSRRTASA